MRSCYSCLLYTSQNRLSLKLESLSYANPQIYFIALKTEDFPVITSAFHKWRAYEGLYKNPAYTRLLEATHGVYSVSYTHLDVYKRQDISIRPIRNVGYLLCDLHYAVDAYHKFRQNLDDHDHSNGNYHRRYLRDTVYRAH